MKVPSTTQAKAAIRRSVDFRGRTTRRDFWRLYVVVVPLGFVVKAVLPPGPLTTVVLALLAVPLASATVRRLHDSGNSGWALL